MPVSLSHPSALPPWPARLWRRLVQFACQTVPAPVTVIRVLVSTICWVAATRTTLAESLQLGGPFLSGMVLQQDMPIRVWGEASPGEQVTVHFGADYARGRADGQGHWRTTLPSQSASGIPATLVVRTKKEQIALDDVLVGEVWLCAGQSNMLWPLARTNDSQREMAAAYHPHLRLLIHEPAAAISSSRAFGPAELKSLHPDRFFCRRWLTCRPQQAVEFPAVPYFFGESLLRRRQVPIGIISVPVGGTPAEAWVRVAALRADDRTAKLVQGNWLTTPGLEGWCRERALQNLKGSMAAGKAVPADELGPAHPFKPGFMWQAAIEPLLPVPIRGVAWYQGESNADSPARVAQHADLFPMLVRDWRQAWQQPELPFVFVQLPGLDRPEWPAFRDSQRRLHEQIPGNGLVITIDLGNRGNVHPGDKRPVGERLAAWADATVYHSGEPVATGPLVERATLLPTGRVRIRFRQTGGQLKTSDGQPPRHFEVAGPSGRFQPVPARIDTDQIVLDCTAETFADQPPQSARYAWQPFPDPAVNLVNVAELPASPFEVPVGN